MAILVVVAVVAVVAVVVAVRVLDPSDRRIGPDPTVAARDSCGGDVPGAVLALDADSGAVRWSALVGDASQVLFVRDTVVVAGGGRLRALAADGGGARWCRDVSATGDEANGAVVVDGNVVAVTQGGLAAFHGSDGSVAWRRTGSWTRLSSARDQVVLSVRGAGATTRTTDALDGVTGRRLWRHATVATSNASSTSPTELVSAPDAGLTYLDDDGAVRAVDRSGEERWMAPGLRPVGVAEGLLVTVGSGGGSLRQEVVLATLELQTGTEVWRTTVPGFDAAVVDGSIVVVDQTNGTTTELSDHDSTVDAYAVADGAELWSVSTAVAVELFPAGELALVETAGEETLAAVDGATGRVAWTAQPANPGRSERRNATDRVMDAAFDPQTRTVFVLLRAEAPQGD